MKWWDIQWVVPPTVSVLIQWQMSFRFWGKEKDLWLAIPAAVMWSIWLTRNYCKFNGAYVGWMELCDLIKVRVAKWFKFGSKCVDYSITDIVLNLKARGVV